MLMYNFGKKNQVIRSCYEEDLLWKRRVEILKND